MGAMNGSICLASIGSECTGVCQRWFQTIWGSPNAQFGEVSKKWSLIKPLWSMLWEQALSWEIQNFQGLVKLRPRTTSVRFIVYNSAFCLFFFNYRQKAWFSSYSIVNQEKLYWRQLSFSGVRGESGLKLFFHRAFTFSFPLGRTKWTGKDKKRNQCTE